MSRPPSRPAGRILLADDDEPFRTTLGAVLERAGFECIHAASAAEALHKLKSGTFDALVSDIYMAGNENLQLVRDLPPELTGLPVILMTGMASVETAAQSVRLRVTAYLVKPPNLADLREILTESTARYRSLRNLRDQRRRLQDWDRELERLVRLLEQGSEPDPRATHQAYLRSSLRNLAVSLIELEQSVVQLPQSADAAAPDARQELLQTIRKAIGVLAETKDHFKSKALGELRRDLESVLDRTT